MLKRTLLKKRKRKRKTSIFTKNKTSKLKIGLATLSSTFEVVQMCQYLHVTDFILNFFFFNLKFFLFQDYHSIKIKIYYFPFPAYFRFQISNSWRKMKIVEDGFKILILQRNWFECWVPIFEAFNNLSWKSTFKFWFFLYNMLVGRSNFVFLDKNLHF